MTTPQYGVFATPGDLERAIKATIYAERLMTQPLPDGIGGAYPNTVPNVKGTIKVLEEGVTVDSNSNIQIYKAEALIENPDYFDDYNGTELFSNLGIDFTCYCFDVNGDKLIREAKYAGKMIGYATYNITNGNGPQPFDGYPIFAVCQPRGYFGELVEQGAGNISGYGSPIPLAWCWFPQVLKGKDVVNESKFGGDPDNPFNAYSTTYSKDDPGDPQPGDIVWLYPDYNSPGNYLFKPNPTGTSGSGSDESGGGMCCCNEVTQTLVFVEDVVCYDGNLVVTKKKAIIKACNLSIEIDEDSPGSGNIPVPPPLPDSLDCSTCILLGKIPVLIIKDGPHAGNYTGTPWADDGSGNTSTGFPDPLGTTVYCFNNGGAPIGTSSLVGYEGYFDGVCTPQMTYLFPGALENSIENVAVVTPN